MRKILISQHTANSNTSWNSIKLPFHIIISDILYIFSDTNQDVINQTLNDLSSFHIFVSSYFIATKRAFFCVCLLLAVHIYKPILYLFNGLLEGVIKIKGKSHREITDLLKAST